MQMNWLARGLSLAVLSTLAYGQVSFDRMLVFGDSLSDTGNVLDLTAGYIPPAPYYAGRFADGPVWHEYVAQAYGVAPASASRTGGTNYAYGAAEAKAGAEYISGVRLPNTGGQIDDFLAADSPDASDMVGYWAGNNNLLSDTGSPSLTIQAVRDDLTRLINAGAEQFIVCNLPPLGEIPEVSNYGTPAILNQNAIDFNLLLSSELASLRRLFHVTIYEVNVHGFMQQAIANPAQYGFTNVTDKALVNGQIIGDPQTWLFWDDLHPTARAHQMLADQILNALPEPSSLVLLSVCLLWRRRA